MGVFKRNGNYWIDYYDGDGRRHRKKISSQKTVAALALKDIKVKVARGEYLGIYETKKILFKDFAQKNYLPHAKLHLAPTTFERSRGIIESSLIPHFDSYLYKITANDIEKFKEKRAGRVKPSTVNKEFSVLRHIFNCGLMWGYVKKNPCGGIKQFKEGPGRVRFLSPEEINRLLDACDPGSYIEDPNNALNPLSQLRSVYLRPITEIALNTGMRRSEILGLRWKDIDFKERRITLEKTKNNTRRTVPMNETVCQALKSLPVHLREERVFPGINSGNVVTVAFEKACKRAGIEDFHFHDLRHTFASYLTMDGNNLRTVGELLGHRDPRMTMRYSHLSPEHLKDAVTTLENTLKSISNSHSVGTKEG